jgi:hypothetical protein
MEKKLDAIAIRLTETLEREAKAFCAANDVGLSEWIRELMVAALAERRREYERLHSIFGQSDELSKK